MNDYYEYIDDYVAGLLKGEQLSAFETELSRNASLKLAVDNYDTAKSISKSLLEIDMLETLNGLNIKNQSADTNRTVVPTSLKDLNSNRSIVDINRGKLKIDHSSKSPDKTKNSLFRIRKLVVAASIIGVVFFAGWWLTRSPYSNINTENIIAIYERPYDENSTKSGELKNQSSFDLGKSQFGLRRFDSSEKYLKKALTETNDEFIISQIHEWLGAAHIFQGEIEDGLLSLGKSNEKLAIKNLNAINSYLKSQ